LARITHSAIMYTRCLQMILWTACGCIGDNKAAAIVHVSVSTFPKVLQCCVFHCSIDQHIDQHIVQAGLQHMQSSAGAAISAAHLTSTIRPLHICTAEAASLPKSCCACRKTVMAAVRLVKDAITACLLDF